MHVHVREKAITKLGGIGIIMMIKALEAFQKITVYG